MCFSCAVLILSDTVLIKTTSYLVDEEFKDEEKIKNGSFWNQQIYKRSVNKFAIFSTFLTLLFHIIKGGVYSNDHLNIRHPMHRGGFNLN